MIAEPDIDAHTGFILAEEASLKKYLSGLKVPNPRKGTASEVPVYFRWPESERRITYPYLLIDLIDIRPAHERDQSYLAGENDLQPVVDENMNVQGHRMYKPGYLPDLDAVYPDNSWHTGRYLPFDLWYQVSSFSRYISHDRYLTSQLLTDVLRPRGDFWLRIDADETWSRCSVLDWKNLDSMETTEAAKRIFRKVYTIKIETEIPETDIMTLSRVRHVHVDLYDLPQDVDAPGHPANGPHKALSHWTEPPL